MEGRLLIPELEEMRGRVRVAPSLAAPAHPRANLANVGLSTRADIEAQACTLAEVGDEHEPWMMVDKLVPHALNDMMLLSSDKRVIGDLYKHSRDFQLSVGVVAACFAEYCGEIGFEPSVAWNFDPATRDREPVQSQQRWHGHLIARTPSEVAAARAQMVPAADLGPMLRRRLVDETSVLASLLFADCLDPTQLRVLDPVAPLSTPLATATIQVRVPGGWAVLADPAVWADLRYIHQRLHEVHNAIMAHARRGAPGGWRRRWLDPDAASRIDLPLADDSRSALAHFIADLRPSLVDNPYVRSRNSSWTAHLYPLADLAITTTISPVNGEVFVHLRVVAFSDIGGAGAGVIDGIVAKTRKDGEPMSEADKHQRAAFQRAVVARVLTRMDAGNPSPR